MHTIVIYHALADFRYGGAIPTCQGTFLAFLPYLSEEEVWTVWNNPDLTRTERIAVNSTISDWLPF